MRSVKFFLVAILLLIFQLSFSQLSFGDTYNWRETHPSNFRIIENGRIEFKLRLRLIHQAVHTIDVIDYDIGGDPVIAQPFLEALRSAADRGVQVRFIRGGYFSKLYRKFYKEPHWNDPVEAVLNRAPTQNPIQYAFFGGWKMLLLGGWSIFAGVHEKLLIVDGRIAIMTGRGLSQMYLDFIDNCTIFKGPLIEDASQAFEKLWKIVHQEIWAPLPEATQMAALPPQLNVDSNPPLPLNSQEKKKLQKLKIWANKPAIEITSANRHEKVDVRFLHHNLLEQMATVCKRVPWIYNSFDCSNQIDDPIISEITALILGGASEMKFYTLGVALHSNLKLALQARLREAELFRKTGIGRDFKLEIFTNSKDAYQEFVFWPVSRLGWKVALKDIDDLMQDGANVTTFVKSKQSKMRYSHRKGVIVTMPDGTQYSFAGSHNLNRTSSSVNDEMEIQIKSDEIAQKYEALYHAAEKQNGVKLDAQKVHNERWWSTLPLWGWESKLWKWVLGIVETVL
jgi:phosphatidylserine/phosphatidylglycerophosphate/cardiolipin synthase-like enzyme